jgi:hypothetical protein
VFFQLLVARIIDPVSKAISGLVPWLVVPS